MKEKFIREKHSQSGISTIDTGAKSHDEATRCFNRLEERMTSLSLSTKYPVASFKPYFDIDASKEERG